MLRGAANSVIGWSCRAGVPAAHQCRPLSDSPGAKRASYRALPVPHRRVQRPWVSQPPRQLSGWDALPRSPHISQQKATACCHAGWARVESHTTLMT